MDGLALLLPAAFLAGALNAVAGGGSFLTFPALVASGVPPLVANATSALAVCPGYLGSTLGFRQELRALPRRRLLGDAAVAALGGLLGAGLLLHTPARRFEALVPWLLLLATLLFAAGPRLAALGRPRPAEARPGPGRALGLGLVAVYGGYFNGGLGILLMALETLAGERRLQVANALKNFNSLVLSVVSVGAFAALGALAWREGLAMMLAATAGGYAGARLARRLPAAALRAGVVATGLAMSAVFFARLPG